MGKSKILDKKKELYKKLIRIKFLAWVISIFFIVLFVRLFYLQIIKNEYYFKLAQNNCVNFIKKRAPRGNIYDRNYKKLVTNVPAYNVGIVPFYFFKNKDINKSIIDIANILNIDEDEIREKIKKEYKYKLEPITIKRDITSKEISLLAEKQLKIEGISVYQEPKRYYPFHSLAAHILGYVGEITDKQLKMKKYKDYKMGDIIGKSGVESIYDRILRGEDGAIYILTDAIGRQRKIIDTIKPKKGKNLVLTIDYRLQKYAEKLMREKKYNGVIIAEIPKTGEILCMVSSPNYDLNYFSGKINLKKWKKLIRDPNKPLTNRAVQGLYSPGSIFKVVVGVGGLEEHIVNTKTTFLCEGIFWIKTWPYKCWKRAGHGWVNFYRGIAESCDIYFYKVGLKMKIELLNKYALMFGLGEKTGIDLPGEKSGLVPSREWKRRVERSPWFPGNTVMMAIGQGYIVATPIQIMNIVTAIANEGYVMKPHIVKVITDDNKRIYKKIQPQRLFTLNVDKKNIKIMKKALKMVVNSRRGTGRKARVKGIVVAGKTATVENIHGETHAMFAGFAPFDDPEIVVYVLVEHGGGGGDVAAPIAGKIIEYYLKFMR